MTRYERHLLKHGTFAGPVTKTMLSIAKSMYHNACKVAKQKEEKDGFGSYLREARLTEQLRLIGLKYKYYWTDNQWKKVTKDTVKSPCIGCGYCCKYVVAVYSCEEAQDNNEVVGYVVPKEMIEVCEEEHLLKQGKDGYCLAFDRKKRMCTIYANRPSICRTFKAGCRMCRKAINGYAKPSVAKRLNKKLEKYLKESAK